MEHLRISPMHGVTVRYSHFVQYNKQNPRKALLKYFHWMVKCHDFMHGLKSYSQHAQHNYQNTKGKHCSIAFIWMLIETSGFYSQTQILELHYILRFQTLKMQEVEIFGLGLVRTVLSLSTSVKWKLWRYDKKWWCFDENVRECRTRNSSWSAVQLNCVALKQIIDIQE